MLFWAVRNEMVIIGLADQHLVPACSFTVTMLSEAASCQNWGRGCKYITYQQLCTPLVFYCICCILQLVEFNHILRGCVNGFGEAVWLSSVTESSNSKNLGKHLRITWIRHELCCKQNETKYKASWVYFMGCTTKRKTNVSRYAICKCLNCVWFQK